MSINFQRLPPPKSLLNWIDQHRPLPPHAAYTEERYKREHYRLSLSLLENDLAKASQDDIRSRLLSEKFHIPKIQISELTNLIQTIIKILPNSLSRTQPYRVLRQMQIFGLHTAPLHLREHSKKISSALSEILRGLGIEFNFEKLNYSERLNILTRLLEETPPELSIHPGITPTTSETLALFQLTSKASLIYGNDLIGPFIISMTKSASDILMALLLTRWTGCEDCLQVIPLFKTIEDLEAAPQILKVLFSNVVYKKHLSKNRNRQVVMIGYSDTNKDGGLYGCQLGSL